MHKVYQNCALMISANKTRDGDGGCFTNGLASSRLVKGMLHEASIAVRQTNTIQEYIERTEQRNTRR
jgi:hypothetical protein